MCGHSNGSFLDRSLTARTFNDRVMQSIVNTEYLRKQFGRNKEPRVVNCLHLSARTRRGPSMCRGL
eukprot:6435736-Amphidinium_carterae.1